MASALPPQKDEDMEILEFSKKNQAFEALAAERGVEFRRKVNEKRERDVQLIRLRHYVALSSEPLPTGSFTRLQNNQIWELVLEYLKNPVDMDSARKTCPTFHDILLEKIPIVEEREVSAVLKILKKENHLESSSSTSSLLNLRPNRDSVPLHLRLISKSWQRATDSAFRTEFQGEWYLQLANGKWWKDDVNVTKVTNIDLIWSLVENSISRSSILQIIHLDEGCMAEMDVNYPRILEFLDEYGESVKGLVIEWKETTISVASKYLNLLSLLLRTPNLKALTIDTSSFYHDPTEANVDDLEDLMMRHRFPPDFPLEVLSVKGYCCRSVIKPLVTEILSKSSKLKSVALPSMLLDSDSIARALVKRQIELIDCNYFNPRKKTLVSLSKLPLKKFVIGNYDRGPSSELFSWLNLLGNTLEHLELPIDPTFIGGSVSSLQLPKLKKLILHSLPGLTNLDFLVPLSNLEHLEFAYNANFVADKNPEHKFHLIELERFDKLEDSNIWTCFPNLRIVKVAVYTNENDTNEEEDERTVGTGSGYRYVSTYHYVKMGKEFTTKSEFQACNHHRSFNLRSEFEELHRKIKESLNELFSAMTLHLHFISRNLNV